MIYHVKKTDAGFDYKNGWDAPNGFAKAETLELQHFMGDKPQHFPKVQARVLYDDKNIYVFFKVHDNYIRAVAVKTHDPVCRDSCVEFFFIPSENLADGYFNVEINCGGTMLLYHQTARGTNQRKAALDDCEKIRIKASLPKIVEPEIQQPTTWTLQYAIDVEMLKKYTNVVKPAKGVKWLANFYKCADNTSHPHWLTWNKVDLPKPDFHRPEFFGTLIFE